MPWSDDDEAKYQRKLRLDREDNAARPIRNDALEKAAKIAERYGSEDIAREIRMLIC